MIGHVVLLLWSDRLRQKCKTIENLNYHCEKKNVYAFFSGKCTFSFKIYTISSKTHVK